MKPKSVTIKLTDAQRAKVRSITGDDHAEVRFEVGTPKTPGGTAGKRLPAKQPLTVRFLGGAQGPSILKP